MRYRTGMMVKSAMDEVGDSSNSPGSAINVDDSVLDKSTENTIHSGHFMVSYVHDDHEEHDQEGVDTPALEPERVKEPKGYDFNQAKKDIAKSYKFGHRSTHHLAIDSSLSKLFKCMTLAYSGKLTSPKWKNFKGIKLKLKDKIRLNNIIWREWHMQYCGKRRKFDKEKDIQAQPPVICQFEPPISDKTHTKPEAVVLEGKYWKRRLESVTAEYKKWRLFFKQRSMQERVGNSSEVRRSQTHMAILRSHQELLERVGHSDLRAQNNGSNQMSFTDQLLMDEDFVMDLSDTLFSSLNQPFPFPNPKEIAQLGNADFIQPGLMQLQPNLDEFMDTLEPLPATIQEMLSQNHRGQGTSQSSMFTPGPIDDGSNLGFGDILMDQQSSAVQDMSSMSSMSNMSNTLMGGSQSTPGLIQSQTSAPAAQGSAPSPNITQLAGNQLVQDDKTSQIFNLVLGSGLNQQHVVQQIPAQVQQTVHTQQQLPIELQQQTLQQIFPLNQTGPATVTSVGGLGPGKFTIIQGNSQISALLQELGQNAQGQAVPISSQATQRPILQSVLAQPALNIIKTDSVQPNRTGSFPEFGKLGDGTKDSRRASTGSMSHHSKKDGDFLVPQVPRNKLRNIVPAPSPPPPAVKPMDTSPKSPIQANNTFLAHLLTNGFSGPNFALKAENKPAASSSFSTISSSPGMNTLATTFSSPTVTFAASMSSPSVTFSANTNPKNSVSDFQKNLLLAAASQAVGGSTGSVLDVASNVLGEKPQSMSTPSSPVQMTSSPSFPMINSPDSDSGTRSRHASNDSTSSYGREDSQVSVKPFRPKNEAERQQYKEHRRASHISAEQKRRCNIKTGFDILQQLVPSLSQNPNAKVSKAATLQKGAEYCKKLKDEKKLMQSEAEVLKQEIESLNQAISMCQSQLPATGVPVTRQRADQMRDMFDEYVKNRTLQNWKFWIFSIIIRPLFDSYNNMVSTASMDELCRTVLTWLEQHCSLVALRPAVLNSLRHLSTTTSILSDPSKVPEQATQAVIQQRQHHNSGNNSS